MVLCSFTGSPNTVKEHGNPVQAVKPPEMFFYFSKANAFSGSPPAYRSASTSSVERLVPWAMASTGNPSFRKLRAHWIACSRAPSAWPSADFRAQTMPAQSALQVGVGHTRGTVCSIKTNRAQKCRRPCPHGPYSCTESNEEPLFVQASRWTICNTLTVGQLSLVFPQASCKTRGHLTGLEARMAVAPELLAGDLPPFRSDMAEEAEVGFRAETPEGSEPGFQVGTVVGTEDGARRGPT